MLLNGCVDVASELLRGGRRGVVRGCVDVANVMAGYEVEVESREVELQD